MAIQLTKLDIEMHATPLGGFTKGTLESWGVPWPPPRGWKKALVRGSDPKRLQYRKPRRKAMR